MKIIRYTIIAALILVVVYGITNTLRKSAPEESISKDNQTEPQAENVPKPNHYHEDFQEYHRDIRDMAEDELSLARLDELKNWLSSIDSEAAAEIISRYLTSGEDVDLSTPFAIGKDGQLSTAPTLRTALLDHLLFINPEAAAKLGREILKTPTDADEWALALRNIARVENDAETIDFLQNKTEELILTPEWQEAPSVGYLNAFDVLVHTRATESTPLLSSLVQRKDRKDLAHASFLTIDRLVQAEPGTMLAILQQDQDLQNNRPEMVAQQFARADFRDDTQKSVVRNWLLDEHRSDRELDVFARTFPNGNQFVSTNLLTSQTSFNGADLRDRDLRSLEVVETWLRMSEFQNIREHLVTMQQRLSTFVKQSN